MLNRIDKKFIRKIEYSSIPNWTQDNHLEAFQALINGDKSLEKLNIRTIQQARYFFEVNYQPYQITNNLVSQNLFTGYFEPRLSASTRESEIYKYPLYGTPNDKNLLDISRRDFEGSIKSGIPILAWLNDKIDLYFMHIQGSGVLKFLEGFSKRFVFESKNNFKYSSLGKRLIELGHIHESDISMTTIKDWLRSNKKNYESVYINESFIFFKEDKIDLDNKYPIGQLGIRLTPLRSLAVDQSIFDTNTPIWLKTQIPITENKTTNFERLMIGQDQGSAIKGLTRGDIFFGNDEIAGNMKYPGNIIILVRK
jgi:membrane-bound lytic murein transglycosylase A